MDLGGAWQQRFVCQQLGQDAASSPAEHSSLSSDPLAVCSPPAPSRQPQPCPYHMSMLVVWVVIPSSSSGARYLHRGHSVAELAQTCPTGRTQPSTSTSHSPQSHHFGGHGLRGHPIGACQAKISCNREPQSRGSPALSSSHGTEQPQPDAGAGTHLSSHSLYQSSAGWRPSDPYGKWSSWR